MKNWRGYLLNKYGREYFEDADTGEVSDDFLWIKAVNDGLLPKSEAPEWAAYDELDTESESESEIDDGDCQPPEFTAENRQRAQLVVERELAWLAWRVQHESP